MIDARFIRSFQTLVLLFMPALAAAQTPDESEPASRIVSVNEIVLDQFVVRNVDPVELYELASQLIGREYFVKEHGASTSPVFSLRLLGESIVLYDTKEEVRRARELLSRLDVAPTETGEAMKVVEFKPRFLSLDTAKTALRGLSTPNVIEERGLLVLQDYDKNLAASLDLLKRLDVPARQVLVTCRLVEVAHAAEGSPLPKELLDNLQKLLPQSAFSQTGIAMLKTAVETPSTVSIRIDSVDGNTYRLSFKPMAMDDATGSLTITDCSLTDETMPGNPQTLFRTSTILRGGEYTVLGATGAAPLLLVVRVTPQG